MPKPKIDKLKLNQLLRSGKSVTDVAKYFNVTPGAISQAKKELNVAVVKNMTMESAHKVVAEEIDTLAQLRRINADANELLDTLRAEVVHDAGNKSSRELALRTMAEIRSQLNLQLTIYQTLFDMQAAAEFQKTVLETIGEVAPDVRDRIISKLKERKAVRSTIAVS